MKASCEEIFIEDFDADTLPGRYSIAIASGVFKEITPRLLQILRSISAVVICDAQGLIRDTDELHRVIHRPFSETPFKNLLTAIDFLKISKTEATSFNFAALPRGLTVLLTLGRGGCEIIRDGSRVLIPAFPVEEIDSTGAGDCFVAGVAHALSLGRPLEEAVLEGNRSGAAAVGQLGVPTAGPVSK